MFGLTPLSLLWASLLLIGQLTTGGGQQTKSAPNYYSSKSKEAAEIVVSFELKLGVFIDSCITDLKKEYSDAGQEKLNSVAENCQAAMPSNCSTLLSQECDKKMTEILNIDLEIQSVVNVCVSSVAPLVDVCLTSRLAVEAKLTAVVSAPEQRNLDRLCDDASSKSQTYLTDCFSKGVAKSN